MSDSNRRTVAPQAAAALITIAMGTAASPALAEMPAERAKGASAEVRCTPNSALRYCDQGDGTVLDTRSGLLWLKDASCLALGPSGDGKGRYEEAKAAAAKLADGQCGLADGSKPGDWRLPTRQEWQAMLSRGHKNPALANAAGTGKWKPGDIFAGVRSEGYWSSTQDPEASDYAFGAGLFGGVVASAGKHIRGFIWPVRNR